MGMLVQYLGNVRLIIRLSTDTKTTTPLLLLLLAILLNVINYHICSPLEEIPQSLLVVGKQYEVCCKKRGGSNCLLLHQQLSSSLIVVCLFSHFYILTSYIFNFRFNSTLLKQILAGILLTKPHHQ